LAIQKSLKSVAYLLSVLSSTNWQKVQFHDLRTCSVAAANAEDDSRRHIVEK